MNDFSVWIFLRDRLIFHFMKNELADRVKSRLAALNKSAAGASLEAGLGRSAITDILSGNTGSPRLATIEKLAPVLECTVAYLIGIEDDATREYLMAPSSVAPDAEVAIAASAAVGVFQEDDVFFSNSQFSKRTHFVRGDPRFPDWKPIAVHVGDRSMEGANIFYDDVLTVIMPPGKPPVSIPLRSGMTVVIKRRVQHEGIFEISIRHVKVSGMRIDFETKPAAGEPRVVTVDLTNIDDNGIEGDPNQYVTTDGRIRVIGIVTKSERALPMPD